MAAQAHCQSLKEALGSYAAFSRSKKGEKQPLHKRGLRAAFNRHQTGYLQSSRRHSELGASTSYGATPEPVVDLTQYYRRLADIAQKGEYIQAEEVLHEMVDAGLEITPLAYHGLIFSCVKGKNYQAALDVLNVEIDTGITPVPESYAVLLHALAKRGALESADQVYETATRTKAGYTGWLAFVRGVVSRGLIEEEHEIRDVYVQRLESMLKEGRLEGWYPDVDTYEDILGLLCEDRTKAIAAEQLIYDDLVMREGVEPETRHFNTVMRAEAVFIGVHNARKSLREMAEGRRGPNIRPDVESFNALLEGCLLERMQGFSYALTDMEEVVAEMLSVGIRMNKRTHALLLMFHLVDHNLDCVLFELREMERLAAPGKALEQVADVWLNRLINYLLANKCVLEVMRIMTLLQADSRDLPLDTVILDEENKSFYTRWLPNFLAGQHFGRRNAGLEKYQEEEDRDDVFMVEDTWINQNNVAIDEATGVEMPLGDMTTSQMKAELEAKGLPTGGQKNDLNRRLRHSRGSQPRSVREEMQRMTMVKSRRSRTEEYELQPPIINEMLVEDMDGFKHGNQYVDAYVVKPGSSEESLVDADSLNTLDVPDDVKELLKEYRLVLQEKDEDRLFYIERQLFNTEDPQFKEVNPNFEGREGYGFKLTWPAFGKGARLAFYMMQVAETLGAGASVKDFVEICEACVVEDDAATAFALIFKMHPYANNVDREVLTILYSKVLLLCMQANRMELIGPVADAMESLELQPIGILNEPGVLPVLGSFAEQATKYDYKLAKLEVALAEAGAKGELEAEDGTQEQSALETALLPDDEAQAELEEEEEDEEEEENEEEEAEHLADLILSYSMMEEEFANEAVSNLLTEEDEGEEEVDKVEAVEDRSPLIQRLPGNVDDDT